MDKREEILQIARRNGMEWEVLNSATEAMKHGQDELQALVDACVDWDLI